nr:MAG TPA: hypothetical protein [Caudoviricetes sp.]
MQKDVLELSTLSDTIYSKRIWVTPSTYQVGYELVTSVEKANEMVTRTQGRAIYFLKYSHVSINGEEHLLESIEGNWLGRHDKQMIKLLFKCEYKEVTHNA